MRTISMRPALLAELHAPPAKPVTAKGQLISFKLELDILELVRKQASGQRIPVSMWLREAAREKLARQFAGKAVSA